MKFEILSTNCNVVNFGTLIPSVLRQWCPKILYCDESLNQSNCFFPKHCSMLGSNSSCPDNTELVYEKELSGTQTVLIHPFFRVSSRWPNHITPRRTPQHSPRHHAHSVKSHLSDRTCGRSVRFSLPLHDFEILVNRTSSTDHAAVRLVIQKSSEQTYSQSDDFTMSTGFLRIFLMRSQILKFFWSNRRSRQYINLHENNWQHR